nr:hypothetical protein [Methanobrevibacter arboriphilus]
MKICKEFAERKIINTLDSLEPEEKLGVLAGIMNNIIKNELGVKNDK